MFINLRQLFVCLLFNLLFETATVYTCLAVPNERLTLTLIHIILRASHVSTAKQTFYVAWFTCLYCKQNIFFPVFHMPLLLNKHITLREYFVSAANQTYYYACFPFLY